MCIFYVSWDIEGGQIPPTIFSHLSKLFNIFQHLFTSIYIYLLYFFLFPYVYRGWEVIGGKKRGVKREVKKGEKEG